MAAGYAVPDLPLFESRLFQADAACCTVRFEEEIKRSRFITTLARADSRERALAFVDAIKKEFPDARHNCWAYAAGRPGDTAQVGQSDDGEPHGTAGRPMLNQLLSGGVGELAAVTTRYFGGIKLSACFPSPRRRCSAAALWKWTTPMWTASTACFPSIRPVWRAKISAQAHSLP